MKKAVLFIQISLMLMTFLQHAISGEFTLQNPLPTSGTIRGLAASGTGLWAVSEQELILHAPNDTDWEITHHAPDSPAAYMDIQFVNSTTGWICGTANHILTTTDSGLTWTPQTSPTAQGDWTDLAMVSEQTGWIIGTVIEMDSTEYVEEATILHTTNGGLDWEQQFGSDDMAFYDIHSVDSLQCHVVGKIDTDSGSEGLHLVTTDGGDSWDVRPLPQNCQFLGGISFVNSTHGWMRGGLAENTALFGTSDGGVTWQTLYTGEANDILFTGHCFADSLNGWLAVLDQNNSLEIRRTTDGGASWQLADETDWHFTPRYYDPASERLFGLGSGSFIAHSTNMGTDWVIDMPNVYAHFKTGSFPDEMHGWAFNNNGTLARTTDGGNQWLAQELPFNEAYYQAMFFVDANTGWVGRPGLLAKTTDGGFTWIAQHEGDSFTTINLHFLNSEIGYMNGIVNGIRGVYRTEDGGDTWVLGMEENITRLHVLNSQTVWCWTSQSGTPLIRTTDGFETWEYLQRPPEALRIFDLFFVDFENGWMSSGEYQEGKYLYRSSDGGDSWYPIGSTPYAARIEFDRDSGFGVIHSVQINVTDDFGETWTQLELPPMLENDPIEDLALAGKRCWFLDLNAKIVRYEHEPLAIEDRNESETQDKLHDFSVSPNPFADKTTIHFSLAQPDQVTLKMYDSSGRLVREVMSERHYPTGAHSWQLETGRRSSGVYFLRLTTKNGLDQTRRAVLIK